MKSKYIVTSRLKAQQGKEDAMRLVLQKAVMECAHHEGMPLYSVQQSKAEPATFLFYEHFDSEETFKAHMESEEIAALVPELEELLDGEPKVEFWSMAGCTGGIQCQ